MLMNYRTFFARACRTARRHGGTIVQYGITALLLACAGVVALSAAPRSPLHFYAVVSGSMEPTLPVGSVVVVYRAPHYAVGDIVTVPGGTPRFPITHRVVAVRETDRGTLLTTQGDANAAPDSAVRDARSVIGRVVWHIPFLGRIFAFLQTPQGFVIAIIIPATIIVYNEVLSLVGRIEAVLRRRRKERKGVRK